MASKSKKALKTAKRPAFYRRKAFLWCAGILVGLMLAVALSFKLSPFPGALLVKIVFTQNGRKTLAALQKHVPSEPIEIVANQQYAADNKSALLDVYRPQSAEYAGKTLPIVIWTHGGAWVSGDKAGAGPYYQLIAAQGYVVISVNYSLAPYKKYPTQLRELNQAHQYVVANAARFGGDPNKIFLAGDSAGAQLSSQLATMITNPDYAKEVGIQMALQPNQLAGVVLFCGIYMMEGLTEPNPNLPKLISWGDDEVVRAYSGTTSRSGPIIRQMSPYYYVTKDFPATFISGGNGDPLTSQQSQPLAAKLQDMGVLVTTLFYAADHSPSLPHEYQFNLDTSDGQAALGRVIDFLNSRTQSQP